MKTIAIIAEFNPFHNGHSYLISKAKNITNADNVVIICSGNYVQRGSPAIYDKSSRARVAIHNGADAVFELPVVYSTASAELFAQAAVKFLDDLNCIDYLCFGCEADNFKVLPTIASILFQEPDLFKTRLTALLQEGYSFPKARMEALIYYCREEKILDEYQIKLLLSQPNNILAIEYLKAIKYFHSNIKPVAIKRLGADYNSLDITYEYASATGIRNKIYDNSFDSIRTAVPHNSQSLIDYSKYICFSDFDTVLGHKLLSTNHFSDIFGINKDLSNRIENLKSQYMGVDSFITELQSKNYTYSGISRHLLHILLGITSKDLETFISNGYFSHIRILGYNRASKILSEIKNKSTLELVSKLSAYYSQANGPSKDMLDISIKADELYRMVYMNKYHCLIPSEFERQIIIK